MVTPLTILFVQDMENKRFKREINWSGPVPAVGSTITWKLDETEKLEFASAHWTVTKADFITRLETSSDQTARAEVVQVNLVAHYGIK
jgi:hypothetical protein